MEIKYDTVVVGGGPSGLIAAAGCALRGKNVIIIEKNRLAARKLLITGKGRCNLTNNSDNDNFLKNVVTNSKFMYSSINEFDCQDTINLFESMGVPLKEERGSRIFPISDKSLDIVNSLIKYTRKSGARIIRGVVSDILKKEDRFLINYTSSSDDNINKIYSKSLVIATGGCSYPLTGSTGDGYLFGRNLGHTIVKIKPSLIPVEIKENFVKQLQGLSLKNTKLSLIHKISEEKNKKIFSGIGELMFTHFGITGPLVLSASSNIRNIHDDYKFELDLKPGLSDQKLDIRLIRDLSKNLNKDVINSLYELLPKKIIPTILKLSNIDYNVKCNQITKDMRNNIISNIKRMSLTYKKLRPIDEAIITCGGIDVKELNPKTMESRLVDNLFFAGEVLDVDAYTGGYNLQIAFSTGYVAGLNA